MEDKDIKALFEKIKKYFEGKDEGSYQMFEMLVRVTIAYRDELVSQGKAPLSVEDTRAALGDFMNVIRTKQFPEGLGGVKKQLVIRWLEELKNMKHH